MRLVYEAKIGRVYQEAEDHFFVTGIDLDEAMMGIKTTPGAALVAFSDQSPPQYFGSALIRRSKIETGD